MLVLNTVGNYVQWYIGEKNCNHHPHVYCTSVVVVVISVKWFLKTIIPTLLATLPWMGHWVRLRMLLLSNKSGCILLLSSAFSKSKGKSDKLMCQLASRLLFCDFSSLQPLCLFLYCYHPAVVIKITWFLLAVLFVCLLFFQCGHLKLYSLSLEAQIPIYTLYSYPPSFMGTNNHPALDNKMCWYPRHL